MQRRRSPRKCWRPAVLVAVLIALSCDAKELQAHETGSSPVNKAARLIEELQVKVAEAAQAEQETYNEFQSFCSKRSQETQFDITSGESKQEGLQAAIQKAGVDMSAAAMHLAELAKYDSTDEADLKGATLLRQKEKADFQALELELVNGIQSTQTAMAKIESDIAAAGGTTDAATADAPTTDAAAANGFLQKAAKQQAAKKPSNAIKAFTDVMAELANAAELATTDDMSKYPSLLERAEKTQAQQTLSKVGSELKRLAFGRNESADPGVDELQQTLQMLKDVEAKSQKSLDESRQREARLSEDYMKLKNALQGKIDAQKRDLENTKRALADATSLKASSEGELSVADAAVKAAKKYLVELQRDCMEKATQFQTQTKSRQEEQLALRNALKALNSIMGTQAAQRGLYSFMQVSLTSGRGEDAGRRPIAKLVLKRVKQLAISLKSTALTQLASRIGALTKLSSKEPGLWDKIRNMIEEMITKLEDAHREAMDKKAFCDQEMKHTLATLEDRQDDHKKKQTALDLASSQVAILREELAMLAKDLADGAEHDAKLTKIRQEEHAAHVKAYKDLELGLAGVQEAIKTLQEYYATTDKTDTQVDVAANMAAAVEGKSPALNTAPVGANAGASVIALLEVVESDFTKQMADMQSEDRRAQQSYEGLMQEGKVLRAQKEASRRHKNEEAIYLERSITELRSDYASAKQQLEAVTEYLAKLKTECTAKVETREERIARRAKEIEGLQECLRILP